MSMLSLAHGQAATSSSYCAWYDLYTTNFPKGATNEGGTDYNDSSIKYNAHSYGSIFAKTGSSNNAEKVSHNGQLCGIMDIAGMCHQWCIGATNSSSKSLGLMKLSICAHDFTKDNRVDSSMHDSFSGIGEGNRNFGGLDSGKSGISWARCGVIPSDVSSRVIFGNDEWYEYYGSDVGLKMGLGYNWGENAGVFCRSFSATTSRGHGYWGYSSQFFGFRAGGYP